MTEIEPHPKLIQYLQTTLGLNTHFDDEKPEFQKSGEWHYIPSDLEKNIFLLKQLDNLGILPDKVHLCDCGVGLGTLLFDLYIQSLEIQKEFTFTGIEKHKPYIDFLNQNLMSLWDGKLTIIEADIMDCNYSKFNLIHLFQPYKVAVKAIPLYEKILEEAPIGSLVLGIDKWTITNYGTEKLIELAKSWKSHKVGDWIILQHI